MKYHSASTMQHCPKFMTVKLSYDALFRKVLKHSRIEMPLCSSMQYPCPYLCLVLLQVPKDFGLVQIFFARSKIDSHMVQVPNFFVPDQKRISIQ